MTDLYLKFADEAEAEPYLYDVVDVNGVLEKQLKYVNTDIIGTLYTTKIVRKKETQVALPGWHVNLRVGEYDPALDQFKVDPEPATWKRMWA